MLLTRKSVQLFNPVLQCARCYFSDKKFNKRQHESHARRKERPGSYSHMPLPMIQGEVLYGIHPVTAAINRQHREIYTAFFKTGIGNMKVNSLRDKCLDKGIPVQDVIPPVLDQMVDNRPHQGVCLDVSPLYCDVFTDSDLSNNNLYTLDDKPAIWLLLYQIKDAMNMGAVLRSAYFFGVKHIIVPYKNSADLSPVVSKASSGALEMMTIKRFSSGTHLDDTMQMWKDLGGVVAGSCSYRGTYPDPYPDPVNKHILPAEDFQLDSPTLLVIGNESVGLPGHITNRCDVLLHIEGDKEHIQSTDTEGFDIDSLNVSAATAILLHSIFISR